MGDRDWSASMLPLLKPEELAPRLIALLEAADIPPKCKPGDEWLVVPVEIGDGWVAHCFYDGPGFDYVEYFVTPDGAELDFWDWEDSPARDSLCFWRHPCPKT
jgi:hypothetical protein